MKVCLANDALLFFLREKVFIGKSLADREEGECRKRDTQYLSRLWTTREWFRSLYTYAHVFSPIFNLSPILLVSL